MTLVQLVGCFVRTEIPQAIPLPIKQLSKLLDDGLPTLGHSFVACVPDVVGIHPFHIAFCVNQASKHAGEPCNMVIVQMRDTDNVG